MSRLVSVFQSAFAALAVVAIGYNFLLMWNSSEGVRMNEQLKSDIKARQARIADLEEQYAFLSGRADRLLTAQLDEDLLEERVRGVLGLVRPDEYLVRMEDLDRLADLGAEAAAEEARLAVLEEEQKPALRYAGLETLLLN